MNKIHAIGACFASLAVGFQTAALMNADEVESIITEAENIIEAVKQDIDSSIELYHVGFCEATVLRIQDDLVQSFLENADEDELIVETINQAGEVITCNVNRNNVDLSDYEFETQPQTQPQIPFVNNGEYVL